MAQLPIVRGKRDYCLGQWWPTWAISPTRGRCGGSGGRGEAGERWVGEEQVGDNGWTMYRSVEHTHFLSKVSRVHNIITRFFTFVHIFTRLYLYEKNYLITKFALSVWWAMVQ